MAKGKDMTREEEETAAEPLSPVSRLLSSPEMNAIILITFGLKIRCNTSAVITCFQDTLLKFPRFSCRLDVDNKNKGGPVWVQVSTRVENQLIVPDLDHLNIENPDEFIEDYCSSIANNPLDMSIPPWEIHVLNIKTSNAESVGIVKMHHSLGDGVSLMSFLLACARKTSDPNALFLMSHPQEKDIWIPFPPIIRGGLLLVDFDTKNPLSSEPMGGIPPRKVIHRIISLDDVKLVKNTMQMKVNDVLLGMTQAGLSRYLSRKFDEDTKADTKKSLERIHLRGTVAVNLRPYTKIEDLAGMMMKGAKFAWGNVVGLVVFPLHIRSEVDPLEYVRKARATMDRKIFSLEAFNSYGATKFTMKFFGEKVAHALSKRLYAHTTLNYTSMMGPNEEISIFDHPVSYVAGSSLTGSHVLNIHIVSYVNKIIISLAVDATVIPDPHRLCDDMVESLNIIKSAALETGTYKVKA